MRARFRSSGTFTKEMILRGVHMKKKARGSKIKTLKDKVTYRTSQLVFISTMLMDEQLCEGLE